MYAGDLNPTGRSTKETQDNLDGTDVKENNGSQPSLWFSDKNHNVGHHIYKISPPCVTHVYGNQNTH